MLSLDDWGAQLPSEDKLHSQLQVRGTQEQALSARAPQGRPGNTGLCWFLAGTRAYLVPVSLLCHRQREVWGTECLLKPGLLDRSTAQESMLLALPFTAGGTGQASRQERG